MGINVADGRFFIKKLPTIGCAAPPLPDSIDLTFTLKRQNFIIEILHLPPAISAASPNNDELNKNSSKFRRRPCQSIADEF